MDITYRHRHPASRLERLLYWLLPGRPTHEPGADRVDFVVSDDLRVSQA